MSRYLKFILLAVGIFQLMENVVLAQEASIVPTTNPSEEASISPSIELDKVPDPEVREIEPLDSWIKRVPQEAQENKDEPAESVESTETVDTEALLEEEKKVYEELVSTYQAPKERNEEIQRIFQKTILTKAEQSRIEKVKSTQRKVRAQVNDRLKKMNNTPKPVEYTIRLCQVSYDIMGLQPEVKSYRPEVAKYVTKLWKDSLKEIITKSCDLVLLSGVVARTSLKGQEFLDKTAKLISLISREDWSIKSGSIARGASYAVLFKSKILILESAALIDKVSLRRGGIFEEEDFSIIPNEMIFRDVRNSEKRFRLIVNDFVYENAPLKSLKVPYQMQMAAALKELTQNRVKSEPDVPVILMANLRFKPSHPAYHILIGSLGLENFLPEGGCVLEEVEEPEEVEQRNEEEVGEDVNKNKHKKKKIIKEKEQILKCDESLAYRGRILFNTFNDLYLPHIKASKSVIRRIAKQKLNATIGNFVLQGDIRNVYSKDKIGDTRAGLLTFGKKELGAKLIWTDFYFKSE